MSVVYVDTSALVKLVVVEAETQPLRQWIGRLDGSVAFATSIATRIELTRATRRHSADAASSAETVLAGTNLVLMSPDLVLDAALLDPPGLRTLDAIHLATARRIGSSLSAFVAYDARLLDAASAAGLPVASPH
ncbi:MAG: type II toxin-antitoxin system VapC family toxin [Actinomycetota bacterium]|nr:type II toxin-antitoxin system VapC family toxin [Actinomycetota bacterium]